MGDNTLVRNVLDTLIDSDPNVSNAAREASLVLTDDYEVNNVDLNVNATNRILGQVSATKYSDSVQVTAFELVLNVNVNSNAANFTLINLWKIESGVQTNIATINTGNISANVQSFNTVSANVSNVANVARNAVLGYNVTTTAGGLGLGAAGTTNGRVALHLRGL